MADCLTVEEFRARFPEFDETTYPDATVQALIDDTCCYFDIERWDCSYKRGHSLYLAHLLTLRSSQQGGDAGSGTLGQEQSKAADGVSVSYATHSPSNFNEAFFAGTSYGQEYLMLLRTAGIGAVCCCEC
jgi:hypothetical protein